MAQDRTYRIIQPAWGADDSSVPGCADSRPAPLFDLGDLWPWSACSNMAAVGAVYWRIRVWGPPLPWAASCR